MRFSAILPAAMATLAVAMPQAALKPSENAPADCSTSYTGNFGLTVVELGKRSLDKRSSCTGTGSLDLTLKDGVLTDSKGRIGSIVANYQFQFDGPPAQAGAIYSSGFSVCSNGSLALGGSTTFYRCLSGDFYNLYDRHWAEQCSPIHLSALACGADAPVPSGSIVGTTMVVTTVVTIIGDGQPQVVPTTIPVPLCQIGDGQVQGHTTPCGELPPVTVTPSAPASQPPYTPPGTPVAPPATTAPVVPPVPTSQVPVPVPSVPSTPVNSTAVVTTPATTATTPATTTTPAAPPVAAGQNLAPASFVALVATLMAVVCLI